MNKKQVQQRVLQNGKPLALSKFTWCEKTKTFASDEDDLVIDFTGVDGVSVKTGSYSTVKTGSGSTVTAVWDSTVTTGSGSTVTTGWDSTVTTGSGSTVTTDIYSTVKTGWGSTVTAGGGSTVKTGWGSTVTTGWGSTVKTGWGSTVYANGENIAIVRRDQFEVITPKEGQVIQTCPYGIKGHLVDGMLNDEPHIIVDSILSKVINKRGNVTKVINHGETKQSYIVTDGNKHAHGATLKEARDSLMYKISDRDTSKYEEHTLDTVVTKAEAIEMYLVITGACEEGVRYFVEGRDLPEKVTVAEVIKLTEGQDGNEEFKKFIERKQHE